MTVNAFNTPSRTFGSAANCKTPDAVTAARRRNHIPEWQLRRVQREIDRYRRMIHPYGTAKAAGSR
jgi:hypothetical protein